MFAVATAVVLAISTMAGVAMANGDQPQTLVQTTYGPVQGYVAGNSIMWTGLRYAVAERFEKPIPPPSFVETYDATASAPACTQLPDQFFLPGLNITIPSQSEDCLFAEIYAPRFVRGRRLRPVTVVFQGNSRWTNDMTAMNVSSYSDRGNVVVVFNYRMGFNGLAVEDGIETNLWFHDQVALLEYVAANIAAFGGDPDRMTYNCQFSNCQDVMMHIRTGSTSPQPKYIVMDNLADVAWYTKVQARANMEMWQANPLIGCNQSTSQERIACLKGLSQTALFSVPIGFAGPPLRACYGPGTLFTKHPFQYLRDGDYNKNIRVMTITPEDAGKSFVPVIAAGIFGQIVPFAAIPASVAPDLLVLYHVGRLQAPPSIIPALLGTYLPMLQTPGMNTALMFAKSVDDSLYHCAQQELVYILQRDNVPVFAAVFTHSPDNTTVSIPYPDFNGVSGYGLLTSFLMDDDQPRGFPQWVKSFSNRENDLVDVITSWTGNFANNGEPRDGWLKANHGYNSIGINSNSGTDMVPPPFFGSRCTDVWAQARAGTPLILTPPSSSPDESTRRNSEVDINTNINIDELLASVRSKVMPKSM